MAQPSNLRTRSTYDGLDDLMHLVISGSQSGSAYVPVHKWTYFGQMIDRKNPLGPGGFRSPGPCEHIRVRRNGTSATAGRHTDAPLSSQWNLNIDYTFHPSTPAEAVLSIPALPAGIALSQKLSAWTKFTTEIPTEVSAFNFFYEFKDFKFLIPNLKRARKIREVPKTIFGNTRIGQKGPYVPRIVKGIEIANSTFLAWNFAWGPFIGDLQKFAGIIDALVRRITYLRNTRSKPVRVHYGAKDIWSDPGPDPGNIRFWTRPPIDGGDMIAYYTLSSHRVDFSASATVLQNLDGLDDMWTDVKATLAALGVTNPAKIVWNAIPFSFMLDWILPIGKMLDRFAIKPFTGQWDVFDVTHSFREEGSFREFIHYYPDDPANIGPQFFGNVDYLRYTRRLGLPLTMSDVNFTSLTNHQQRLFLSLIAGNTLFKGK